MESLISNTVALLGLAMVVAIVARRLKLPYTVGLVATGIFLALAPIGVGLTLTHDVIFNLILPPLLFEAALNLHWRELKRHSPVIIALSTLGVAISAAVVTGGLIYLFGWPLPAAFVFAALISATDPIAVIAVLRQSGVTGRLSLVIEAESLFNDGVAAVLFALALAGETSAGLPGPGAALEQFLYIAGVGVGVGAGAAGLALVVAGRTEEHLVETAITMVAAYGSFLAAERVGASGVLATVTAGLVLGNIGVLAETPHILLLSEQGRRSVRAFWEFAAFLANSFVFLLIGEATAHVGFRASWLLTDIIGLTLLARALSLYPVCALFAGSRWRIPWREQHFMWWSGLRGALGLALALTIPGDAPYRGEIIVVAFAVVTFSVIVQGLTAGLALKGLRLQPE